MDLADRYLNNKCIKYALRNEMPQEADRLIKLFLKDPNDGSPFDLQTLWYESQLIQSHNKLKQWNFAIGVGKFITKHFHDMSDDQIDFHTYCLRKYTLISYMNFLNYQDDIYNNKHYIRGASSLIQSFIK